MKSLLVIVSLLGLCCAPLACSTPPASTEDTSGPLDAASDRSTADESTFDTQVLQDGGLDDSSLGDTAADLGATSVWPELTIAVGVDACCLAISASRVLWAESGDIWMHDSTTSETRLLVGGDGNQTQPAIDGDRVVWSDDRGGDFDLYTLNLTEGVVRPLVEAPGDQVQASLHDDVLVWIDMRRAPHGPLDAEVYMWNLAATEAEPTPLTDDDAEQSDPTIRDGRIVWTDFSADPDRYYIEGLDPNENNGDIIGYDLATSSGFVVTRNTAKQTRATINGDSVVWLDWRGIQPEPKYHRFMLYTASLVDGGETRIAEAGLAAPNLQIRPSVGETHVVWLGMRPAGDGSFDEGEHVLMAASLDGSDPLVGRPLSEGGYQAATLLHGLVAAVGAGRLDVAPLSQLLEQSE